MCVVVSVGEVFGPFEREVCGFTASEGVCQYVWIGLAGKEIVQ